ncbi:helix-turn-helix domain-containing protein [Defluviimonas sp. WL0024]|uniref:Helix-turn-helix domain-containing protein n=1 Tax=Albidovulum salinarum TaxID=2984153 RepID=A0ABT2X4R6_9RHOB|nr:helix-turn-helix domain-containing protein [Defluviimonas sp. WL0024]MCU9848939.1 helix-turn-helix domain-containing protein [Defluviimonas sp. WL0024]
MIRSADAMSARISGLPDRVTQDELADHWRLSTRTLERWRANRTGPAWMKLEGRVLYRAEDILAFEETQMRHAESSS